MYLVNENVGHLLIENLFSITIQNRDFTEKRLDVKEIEKVIQLGAQEWR